MEKQTVVKGKYKVVAVSHKNNSLKLRNNNGERWFTVPPTVSLPDKGEEVLITYRKSDNTKKNPEIVSLQVINEGDTNPTASTNGNERHEKSQNGNNNGGRHKFVYMSIAALLSVIPKEERDLAIKKALQIVEQL